VALLQDRNGVIDIDLPLSGSLDDPQFSIGALIVKAVVNLLTKIVTAPFSVLADGGTDLSMVEFKPGTAELAGGSQQVVDTVATALLDRPGLKLGITGQADAKGEAAALQRALLESKIVAEQRRDRAGASLGSAGANDAPLPPLPPLPAQERARIVYSLYIDSPLADKPRDMQGALARLPLADMEERLRAAVPVDAAATRALAVQRARAVRDALIAKGLGGDRLFLTEPKVDIAATDNGTIEARARLALSAD
jgi:hypothetical protein